GRHSPAGAFPRPGARIMSGGIPASGTADLVGYGRLEWSELARILGGAQTAWAGYDGFHIGHAPSAAPPYSHLWAWTDQWLIRARIDGDQAIVGALILAAAPAGAPARLMTENVRYERATARTWDADEKRVGPMAPAQAGRPVDVFLVSGAHPVTFVAGPAG
ncbi:MAG TPA: hypothetical protein VNF47_01900, partial [Streptosporangiaceae bacterium]|nr:hypothetical protein [Streptosporangiaceae bacterium]